MSETVLPTHETLLRLCAADAPHPWNPKVYAQKSGVQRGSLDALLNDLRVAGLVRLSDWQKHEGQGYLLTELGKEVLANPALLAQLRTGSQKLINNRSDAAKSIDNTSAPTRYDIGETARRSLYEPTRPRIMPVLLALNVIVFGISIYVAQKQNIPVGQFVQQGNGEIMHELGALTAADLVHGEWWRLLTCCFLHFGLLHLFVNMYSLHVLGLVESLFGSTRYLILYLMAGVGGSCAAMIWDPGADRLLLLAGASGAIWGLMGGLAAWLFLNRSYLNPRHVAAWTRSLAIVFLINVGVSMIPAVSASAHFGGGAVGFIVASLLHVQRFAPPPRRLAALILLLALPLLGFEALTYAMANDPRWLRIEQAVAQQEHRAVLVRFKQDVVPAVDEADQAFVNIRDAAYILTDKAPANRAPDQRAADKLRLVQASLSSADALAKTALEKLGEKPLADERAEAARQAGRDYLQLVVEQIAMFQKLLDQKQDSNPAERSKLVAEIKKARVMWLEKRGQLL